MTRNQYNNQFIVVKVGTTTMFRSHEGKETLDDRAFAKIGRQVLDIINNGGIVAIVSSGAVTAGMQQLGIKIRPALSSGTTELQALSTIGCPHVVLHWDRAIKPLTAGSFLLTKVALDAKNPERTEALQTMASLICMGGVPIINENDAITHSELSYNSYEQNDNLAANVAICIAQSQLFGNKVVKLVILSDVDGLYEDHTNNLTLVKTVHNIDDFIHVAVGSGSHHGKGGMTTKLQAAKIATEAGVEVCIANGKKENSIQDALSRKTGTLFRVKAN